MKRKQSDTSLAAYHSLDPEQVKRTKEKILSAIMVMGSSTSLEIAKYLGADHDVIWKRCSDLKNIDKKLYWTGEKRLGKRNRFMNVFGICDSTQPKTDSEIHQYKKGEKTASDYASDLINSTKKLVTVFELPDDPPTLPTQPQQQISLFP